MLFRSLVVRYSRFYVRGRGQDGAGQGVRGDEHERVEQGGSGPNVAILVPTSR